MKVQDIAFIIVALALIYKQNPKWFAAAGLICLVLSIPLFSAWVFFTAQRLVYYAAAFFLFSIVIYLLKAKNRN